MSRADEVRAEFLEVSMDRINKIVEGATIIGDRGPSLGTILAIAGMTDEEFTLFANKDEEDLVQVLAAIQNSEARLVSAGLTA